MFWRDSETFAETNVKHTVFAILGNSWANIILCVSGGVFGVGKIKVHMVAHAMAAATVVVVVLALQ